MHALNHVRSGKPCLRDNCTEGPSVCHRTYRCHPSDWRAAALICSGWRLLHTYVATDCSSDGVNMITVSSFLSRRCLDRMREKLHFTILTGAALEDLDGLSRRSGSISITEHAGCQEIALASFCLTRQGTVALHRSSVTFEIGI